MIHAQTHARSRARTHARRYTESETGGWGLGPSPQPSDVDLPGGSSYCDVAVFEGVPTKEEFALLVDRNEPVLFRGGARDWRIRKLWKKDNFLRKYGNRTVRWSFAVALFSKVNTR